MKISTTPCMFIRRNTVLQFLCPRMERHHGRVVRDAQQLWCRSQVRIQVWQASNWKSLCQHSSKWVPVLNPERIRQWNELSYAVPKIQCRVTTYHTPQNSLTFPWFSLIFYSFPYPLTDQKIIFILHFNGANCITSNGVILKGRNLLPMGANSFL